uniref:Uncharacterized protein n=1 Tax=Cyclopterus lumpus TaxID=8103 RepID=A0A8C2ZEJ9_CYCLU
MLIVFYLRLSCYTLFTSFLEMWIKYFRWTNKYLQIKIKMPHKVSLILIDINFRKASKSPASTRSRVVTVGRQTVVHPFLVSSFSLKLMPHLASFSFSPPRDLCAAILLACLFCHPLDCLPAAARGCAECARWLCGFLCGCEPGTLRPLLEAAGRRRDLCGGPCACPGCLQASECLDLSMEISQMLYH